MADPAVPGAPPPRRQLALDLTAPPALSRADFLVTDAQAEALAMLDDPARWPQGRLLLIGPEGAGKTHMASFWAAAHGARIVPAAALAPAGVAALAAPGGALAIEDADRGAGRAGVETALFHLWNLAPARGCLLLLTARTAPRDWGLVLPDLRSRFDAAAQARLHAPDEALLAAVLVKLFADRQVAVPAGLVAWLARHMDRDLGLARRLVAALDRAALEGGGPVTRRLAEAALARLQAD